MKRKLCVLAVTLTLVLFFANGFAKKDDSNIKDLQYEGFGYLRYWNYGHYPCDSASIPKIGSTTEDSESIRIYEFVLHISIRGDNVLGSIEIYKWSPTWCRETAGIPVYLGEFPIENGQVVENAISFTVVVEGDPGEYSLSAFYFGEDDSDLGEFNGGEVLIGGAVKPGGTELIYVTLDPAE